VNRTVVPAYQIAKNPFVGVPVSGSPSVLERFDYPQHLALVAYPPDANQSRPNMHRTRALTHQLSDLLAKSFLRTGVPSSLLTMNPGSGITLPCANPKFGDYQCSLPVAIYRSHFNAGGSKKSKTPEGAPAADAAAPTPLKTATTDKGVEVVKPSSLEDFGNKLIANLDPDAKSLIGNITCAKNGFLNIFVAQDFLQSRALETVLLNDVPRPTYLERDMQILQANRAAPTGGSHSGKLVGSPYPVPPESMREAASGKVDFQALPRTVSIDYSSPNIAKEMHVGHVRSTLLGDALSRIMEFAGFRVNRVNHLGDWGTQFGMLIAHLLDMQQGHGDVTQSVSDLQTFYQAAKRRFDSDPEFKHRAREYVVRLQSGTDEVCTKAWSQICQISQNEFRKVYARLGVDPRLTELGESFYNPYLKDVVEELLHQGVAIEKDGAVLVASSVVPGEKTEDQQPTNAASEAGDDNESATADSEVAGAIVIRKKDGGYTYGTTDLAALRYRLLGERWFNPANAPAQGSEHDREQLKRESYGVNDWILYVVDAGQSLHFSRVFEAGRKCGWVEEAKCRAQKRWENALKESVSENDRAVVDPSQFTWNARIEHIGFGVVLGENGKRLRTRSGESIKLSSLLDESVRRAGEAVLAHRKTQTATNSSEQPGVEGLEEVSASIGYGAIKYADLKRNRIMDYIFSFDAMLDLKGDTAVYLMYTHARMFSILYKASMDGAYAEFIKELVGRGMTGGEVFMQLAEQGERHPQKLVAGALVQYSTTKYDHTPFNAPLITTPPYFDSNGEVTPEWFNAHAKQQELGQKLSKCLSQLPTLHYVHASELNLLRQLVLFHDALAATITHMMPSHLCAYLSELCQRFSNFYRDCQILGSSGQEKDGLETHFTTQDQRILLTHATALTLRRGLQLLGIDSLKRM